MKITKHYTSWLSDLKLSIDQVRLQTSVLINTNMLIVYWYIGKQILEKQEEHGWGTGIIKQLAIDLRKAFPETKGFSERNLVYMRQFANLYTSNSITQAPLAQLQKKSKKPITQAPLAQLQNEFEKQKLTQVSWAHHIILMDKIHDHAERIWYIQEAVINKWSSRVLLHQIDSNLYHRQYKKKKITNFHLTLPKEQSDLALQMLKDPYQFDFLQIEKDANERTLETQLTTHIQQFLLELGAGFAYVGRQFKLKIGRKEYFLDLLFYHLHLRCFIVIDLKMGEFEPEFAGKMNAYLNVLNKEHKQIHDNASIGIILCNSKDEVEVEYALQGLQHPIGVSEYKTMHTLPKNLRDKLPSAKQLKDVMKAFNEQHSTTNIKPKKKK